MNLVFVTDKAIKKLSRKYKHKNSATDVLAFGMNEPPDLLGDIVISVDTAKRAAKKFDSSMSKEIRLYVIHGILHLLGFDDRTKQGLRRMKRVEEKLFREMAWNSKI